MNALRPPAVGPGLTPLMRQYLTIKAEHPGCVLLFRMGDFWETFYEDAVVASQVLGIALTARGADADGERIPLAGVPLSSLEPTVAKLVAAGHRVAVCDQVEDPRFAKGIVKRSVVEVVSAGTATLPGMLEERASRFLVAALPDVEAGRVGLARCDLSTGEFVACEIAAAALADEIDRLAPAEVLVPDTGFPPEWGRAWNGAAVVRLAPNRFPAADDATRVLREGPGITDTAPLPLFPALALGASAALYDYLGEMRRPERNQLAPLSFEAEGGHLVLDEISLRNLEILRPLRDGATGATLLSVLDRTRTPMGARLMRSWLGRPLLSTERIQARLDAVQEIADEPEIREFLAALLGRVGDVARLAMRVAAGRAHGRDLVSLAESLAEMPALRAELNQRHAPLFAKVAAAVHDFSVEVDTIREAIVDEPPLGTKDGGVIREGYSDELDRLRSLARSGKDWIAELQAKERARSGIGNLKIGYNRVFGYYLEVTKSHRANVPADYERRQTLVNAERYVTPELKERESEILGAEERSKALEYDLFVDLRDQVARACARIRETADALAALDVLLTLAESARRRNWVRPLVDEGERIDIRAGRHPVVEAALPAHEFVPNDVLLDGTDRQILLITGPNMAGKSTYLRQVALLVILAQMGSYVPAESATIGVVDRVFTRVGASDHVAAGHSTFMVEMVEVSRILGAATPRSLVLLDEVGRGTSTYDGLAIAWSVMEYLHERPERAARTLFATHYHELTELADRLDRARNFRVTVHEWQDDVVFLRKIVEGAADRSFGIQVAQLAGLPADVTRRAKKILAGLEDGTFLQGRDADDRARGSQLDLFSSAAAAVLGELSALDPNQLTPMDALAVLHEWKRRTRGEDA